MDTIYTDEKDIRNILDELDEYREKKRKRYMELEEPSIRDMKEYATISNIEDKLLEYHSDLMIRIIESEGTLNDLIKIRGVNQNDTDINNKE